MATPAMPPPNAPAPFMFAQSPGGPAGSPFLCAGSWAGAAGLFAVVVYLYFAAPTMGFLDASEFAAAGAGLGIAHPPGHPLCELWIRLFMFLPLGGLGFRAALSQAAAAGLAVGAFVAFAERLGHGLGLARHLASPLACGAAALFAFSGSFGMQAIRPEVYALSVASTLLGAALALAALQTPPNREAAAKSALSYAASAIFVLSLGLANHHLLAMVGALPLVTILAVGKTGAVRPLGQPAYVALGLVALVLGLSLYVYLPLRAAADAVINWGRPSTVGRFIWVVTAQAFAKAVHQRSFDAIPFEAMASLGIFTVISGLAGWFVLLRTAGLRRLGVLLMAEVGLYVAAAGVVKFDPANPDSHGYLSTGLAFVALSAYALWATMAAMLARRRPRLACAAVYVVLAGLVVYPLATQSHRYDQRENYAPERVLDAMFEPLAPASLLVARYFQTDFALFYAQTIDGRRPDVEVVHGHFFDFHPAWYLPSPEAQRALGAAGIEPPALAKARLGGADSLSHPPAPTSEPAHGLTIYEEYDLSAKLDLARLEPAGFFYKYVKAERSPDAFAEQDAFWSRLDDAIARDVDRVEEVRGAGARRGFDEADTPKFWRSIEIESQKYLLWSSYLAAHFRCAVGNRAAAAVAIDRAGRLGAAHTPELESLAAACR